MKKRAEAVDIEQRWNAEVARAAGPRTRRAGFARQAVSSDNDVGRSGIKRRVHSNRFPLDGHRGLGERGTSMTHRTVRLRRCAKELGPAKPSRAGCRKTIDIEL